MAGEHQKRFNAALQGCDDKDARRALSQILAVFKLVRRARTDHRMTEADADTVLLFPQLFTIDLPNNPFWARNATTLGPQLQMAVTDWIESATHAPTTAPDGLSAADKSEWVAAKERQVSTQSTIYSFVSHAVMMSGGDVTGLRARLATAMTEE